MALLPGCSELPDSRIEREQVQALFIDGAKIFVRIGFTGLGTVLGVATCGTRNVSVSDVVRGRVAKKNASNKIDMVKWFSVFVMCRRRVRIVDDICLIMCTIVSFT